MLAELGRVNQNAVKGHAARGFVVRPGALPARSTAFAAFALVSSACSPQPDFDLIIRGGTVYDGTGEQGVKPATIRAGACLDQRARRG
jgi:hypothetical protein